MTIEGRVAELKGLIEEGKHDGYETVGQVFERVQELMGRPVWTHEYAQPDLLYHEVRTGIRPTMEGVIAKLPQDKPALIVEVDDE